MRGSTKVQARHNSKRDADGLASVQSAPQMVLFQASHQLPSAPEAEAALAAFMKAAAAAEAAQQQLLQDSSSPLAKLLAEDIKLLRIAEAYSEVQRLHHMAIQQKLQQYGSTAATLPGFVYACAAEAAGKARKKAPEDTIDLGELCSLGRQLSTLQGANTTSSSNRSSSSSNMGSSEASMQLLAKDLLCLSTCGTGAALMDTSRQLLSDLRLLVLPDLATLLLESLDPAAAAATCPDLPTTARQDVGWVHTEEEVSLEGGTRRGINAGFCTVDKHSNNSSSSSRSSASVINQQLVASLLQQGLAPSAPGSTPLLLEQQELTRIVDALGGMR
jgi:hypothetical protein